MTQLHPVHEDGKLCPNPSNHDSFCRSKTDLEMTKLCAEAMKLKLSTMADGRLQHIDPTWIYDPLHDDAQAMALVKRFNLTINYDEDVPRWLASKPHPVRRERWIGYAKPDDLNRAIVECCARMQAAKVTA